MSTSYKAVCFDCKRAYDLASGSGFYGFKVWDAEEFAKWLGHGMSVGTHEGHDVRIVSEHVDLPWEFDEEGEWIGPTPE